MSVALEGERAGSRERGRGAETRRRGCRLDGKLMFTAESTQRFQGERRCARPGRPRARDPRGRVAASGAATKLEARAGRVRPAPVGPKFPAAAGAQDPPPLGARIETRQRVFQRRPWEAEGRGSFRGRFLINPVGYADPFPPVLEARSPFPLGDLTGRDRSHLL